MKHIGAEVPDFSARRHAERIHTIGYVTYERMADYYRAADVCVSIPSSDSSPRSVWEAWGVVVHASSPTSHGRTS